jgi:hypothetical protein
MRYTADTKSPLLSENITDPNKSRQNAHVYLQLINLYYISDVYQRIIGTIKNYIMFLLYYYKIKLN